MLKFGCHDNQHDAFQIDVTQHNDTHHKGLIRDIQYNDTQHNDTQHEGLISDVQFNDTQHNDTVIMLNVIEIHLLLC
jgi:hypothetical protein